MSISEENVPFEPNYGTPLTSTATVVPSHEGEEAMGARSMTVGRYEEIRRRLAEGRGVREIARALGVARDTVRKVRDGLSRSPDLPKPSSDPLWMGQLEWPAIVHDLGLGHPLKFIWDEKAQHLTTYSNFWKQFYRKFPQYRETSVTARDFDPGE
jgi:hypothetical protein